MRSAIIIAVASLAARRAHAKGCTEVSDVVGYHHCTRFGVDWSRDADIPRADVEVSHYFHHFLARPFGFDSAPLVSGTAPVDFHGTSSGELWRVVFGLGPVLYVGGEAGGAGLERRPLTLGTPVADGFELDGYVIGGLHLYERYRVALSTELAAGGQAYDFFACAQKGCPDHGEGRWALEARVRADVFVHPHLSLGIGFGRSLVAADDHLFTISLGIHGRAIDGQY